MPNPWLRWLCLRGSLQALPPAWPPTLALWALALAMILATGDPRGGMPGDVSAPLAAAAAEIALCWLLLRRFRRHALLLPALQALAMAAAVRAVASLPLLWLAMQPPPTAERAGGLLLAFVAVVMLELVALAWLLRYWFRLWKQALQASDATVALVIVTMALLLSLPYLALG
ncbi:hypothetical protein [Luteimonas salinilitoris]|uniref:Uncharacterized protein n=1 Tax=Luteimonas salinilitoris TaxID=3237697 RepID=A0ABV4HZQ0_9GAMM